MKTTNQNLEDAVKALQEETFLKNEHQFSTNYSTKIERKVTILSSFYKASIILIPKLNKNLTKKENCILIF
jgi:hypothetical protein